MSLLRLPFKFIILLADTLYRPSVRQHSPQQKTRIARACKNLALYQFEACPFCVKVRWVIRKLGLPIEIKDAKNDPNVRDALKQGGGKVKVPCLRISTATGVDKWLYESSDIVDYLRSNFSKVS